SNRPWGLCRRCRPVREAEHTTDDNGADRDDGEAATEHRHRLNAGPDPRSNRRFPPVSINSLYEWRLASRAVELHQLRCAVAVVDHGGFTRAARALHLSQPSLSYAIARLE